MEGGRVKERAKFLVLESSVFLPWLKREREAREM